MTSKEHIREIERNIAVDEIMKDAYKDLDDAGMLNVALDLLGYLSSSMAKPKKRDYTFTSEKAVNYLASIKGLSQTTEEENFLVVKLMTKLIDSGTKPVIHELYKQDIKNF